MEPNKLDNLRTMKLAIALVWSLLQNKQHAQEKN